MICQELIELLCPIDIISAPDHFAIHFHVPWFDSTNSPIPYRYSLQSFHKFLNCPGIGHMVFHWELNSLSLISKLFDLLYFGFCAILLIIIVATKCLVMISKTRCLAICWNQYCILSMFAAFQLISIISRSSLLFNFFWLAMKLNIDVHFHIDHNLFHPVHQVGNLQPICWLTPNHWDLWNI